MELGDSSLLLHGGLGTLGILESVWYQLVSEELIHLFQSPALGLWEEEDVADHGDDVEDEEYVEVSEADGCQSLRAELRKDQVDGPVCEGGDGVSERANLHGEDLGGVHPGNDTERSDWR